MVSRGSAVTSVSYGVVAITLNGSRWPAWTVSRPRNANASSSCSSATGVVTRSAEWPPTTVQLRANGWKRIHGRSSP